MGRTRALFAAIPLFALALVAPRCFAQEAQANVAVDAGRGPAVDTGALSPGHSLFWARMHVSQGEALASARDANVLADRIMQTDQRRFCAVLYLAILIQGPAADAHDRTVPDFSPCS